MGRRGKATEIRRYLLAESMITEGSLATSAASRFQITRQAAHRHLMDLVEEGILTAEGSTRARVYRPILIDEDHWDMEVNAILEEDRVWEERIRERAQGLPENVYRILHYGFTEMLNNVRDHSNAARVAIQWARTRASVAVWIKDDGVGIFRKIQDALKLPDRRQAALELVKGKFTTDPDHHTGQGIFFSSRMFDVFVILSEGLWFEHALPNDDWLIESQGESERGTVVTMVATNWCPLNTKDVFDQYAGGDDYRFSKTHVPLMLAQFGAEMLVSRSQAKRVLARVEGFDEVFLDYRHVNMIGQAFADEIYRVFARAHPNVRIITLNDNPEVKKMIRRAQSHPVTNQRADLDPPANDREERS